MEDHRSVKLDTIYQQLVELINTCPTDQHCIIIKDLTDLFSNHNKSNISPAWFESLETLLTCPITFDRLIDPWMTPLHHVYERSALEKLCGQTLPSSDESLSIVDPLTRQEIHIDQLKPATQIKRILDRFHQLLALHIAPKSEEGLKQFEQIREQCVSILTHEYRLMSAMLPHHRYLIRQFGYHIDQTTNQFVLLVRATSQADHKSAMRKITFTVNENGTLSIQQNPHKEYDSVEQILIDANFSDCKIFTQQDVIEFQKKTNLAQLMINLPSATLNALILQLEYQYSVDDIKQLQTCHQNSRFVRVGNYPTTYPALTVHGPNGWKKIMLKDSQLMTARATKVTHQKGLSQFQWHNEDEKYRQAVITEYQQLVKNGLLDQASPVGLIFTATDECYQLNHLFSPRPLDDQILQSYDISRLFSLHNIK